MCQQFFSKKINKLTIRLHRDIIGYDELEVNRRMTIYERIKELREKKGMTQEDLAIKVGYKTRSAINKIEAGIRDINQTQITAFAKALGTTPGYLMGWEDDEADPITVAAHATEDLTPDEMKQVLDYIKFVKSQRGRND